MGGMNILVSACLLGEQCRYDGQSRPDAAVLALQKKHTLIPICPEQLGGLPTPRPPAERVGNAVINCEGRDVTDAYERGARETLRIAQAQGCKIAVLKEKSPSCGKGRIYDGSFCHRLTEGDGICAAHLSENGIAVFGETQIAALTAL